MGALFMLICILVIVIWLALSPFFSRIGDSVSKFGPKEDQNEQTDNNTNTKEGDKQ